MSFDRERISSPARVANPEEGISVDELQLAARNHGMPLEALRWLVIVVVLYAATVMARSAIRNRREHRAEGATAPVTE